MKRAYAIPILAALAGLLIPSTAAAQPKYSDKTGRFGIGYDASLASVGGLSARFQVAKNFGIQAIAAFDRTSSDIPPDGTSVSTTAIQVAVRGDLGLAFTNKTSLSTIFGVDVFNVSFSEEIDPTMDESDARFAFEAGLKVEYHFTDWLSMHTEVGFVFALFNRVPDPSATTGQPGGSVPPRGEPLPPVDGTILAFGLADGFGQMGFTFWFN